MGIGPITLDASQQNEAYNYRSRMLDRPAEEAGFFTGAGFSLFKGFEHAAAVGSAAFLAGEPELVPEFIQNKQRDAYQWMVETRPDPKTMGILAQMGHGLGTVFGMGAVGAPFGLPGAAVSIGGLSGYDKYSELIDAGVDHDTALKAAGLTGAVMGAGAFLPPYLGKTLAKQVAAGAGINLGLGFVERGGTSAILEKAGYADMAQHYKMLDGTAMAIDAVLGAAFPIGARMLRRAPTGDGPSSSDIDTALLGSEGLAERTRDPALQTTLEGMDKRLAADMELTRQILEEGKPLSEVRVPPGLMDDVIPNPALAQTTAIAARAMDDLFSADGLSVGRMDSDITAAAKIMQEVQDAVQIRSAEEMDVRKRAEDGEAMAKRDAAKEDAAARAKAEEAEIDPDQYTNVEARAIADANPDMRVFDDMGVEKNAKQLLDEAEQKFQQEKRESMLFKIAVSCAIGAGE